jgi:peptidyl-prolyl cis-trans isomerase B (cyclophilin B)
MATPRTNRRVLAAIGVVAVLGLAGCGGSSSSSEASSQTETDANGCRSLERPPTGARTEKKPTQRLDPAKTYDLTLRTNCGDFTVRLDVKSAPATTASLVSLARHGYFDKTIFHRIVPGFVIQGGDPTAQGTGDPGYRTVDPPPAGARYTHGVVAMAKAPAEPPGTSGSQFFVVTGDDVGLPPDYAIVGRVTKGLGVVDKIGALGDPSTEQPTEVVEIDRATVSSS